ncbi:amidohydrolase family protein [Longimicrobium sp.]|uniref:amidohydrolase family protein n=1 Tax=Longimicrobium sp. TaxID=2029185 RepID=UPI002E31AA11|nr:amidohydrolase family protein [Longimicrobium sp.]HEX6041942.1 amidohydrolase family protein [Longimicrobium sp.]
MTGVKIDCHVHLAGVGTNDSGCWISPVFARRPTFRLLRMRHGMSARQMRESADADWAADVADRVRRSELTHAVALGFDGVYGADGRLDTARSQMVIPHGWVFEVCRRHPELLPGPSVNPHRRDALERIDECIERGAVLIKWLPATQDIDPADPRITPFYRRLADAGIPLLVHSGGSEQTFAQVRPELKDLRRLELPLSMGVRIIVAHTAAPVTYARDEDQVPLLKEWMRRYPHLWVDNSGISNPSRFPHLPRFAADPELVARTLHGSDFPVPSNAFWYLRRLGARRVAALERIRNRMQRDVEIKRALGYPDDVLTRAPAVLANLARWIPRANATH